MIEKVAFCLRPGEDLCVGLEKSCRQEPPGGMRAGLRGQPDETCANSPAMMSWWSNQHSSL